MSNLHKEMLEELVRNWDKDQLTKYILEIEQRIVEMKGLIQTLKTLRRRKNRKIVDTGARDGR